MSGPPPSALADGEQMREGWSCPSDPPCRVVEGSTAVNAGVSVSMRENLSNVASVQLRVDSTNGLGALREGAEEVREVE